MTDINTITDFITIVAEALTEGTSGDHVPAERTLEELRGLSESWLQTDEERDAQLKLVNAVVDAIEAMDLDERRFGVELDECEAASPEELAIAHPHIDAAGPLKLKEVEYDAAVGALILIGYDRDKVVAATLDELADWYSSDYLGETMLLVRSSSDTAPPFGHSRVWIDGALWCPELNVG